MPRPIITRRFIGALYYHLPSGKTSGRTDDNIDTIKKRFTTFTSQTLPVVAALKEKTRVVEIDASGSIDDISTVVMDAISKVV